MDGWMPPPPKNRAAPFVWSEPVQPRVSQSSTDAASSTRCRSDRWFSPVPRAHERSADSLRPARTWGREDVAHLRLRVPTLLALTCDLTNSQSRRNSSRGTLSWRFYFYHPAPLPPLPPPLSLRLPSLLYEKTPGAAEAPDVQTRWLMLLTLCNWSALIVFLFLSFFSSFPRFRGPVRRWWHPVTNAAAAGIMDDGHTSPHLNVFFVLFFPFSWEQTDYLVSNDIQFPFIVVLVSGFVFCVFFKHPWKVATGSRCREIPQIPKMPLYTAC